MLDDIPFFSEVMRNPEVMIELAMRAGIALIVVVLAWLTSGFPCRFAVRVVWRLVHRGTSQDTAATGRIAAPLRLTVLAIGGYGAGMILQASGLIADLGDKFLGSMIVVSVFWSMLRLASASSDLFGHFRDSIGHGIFNWAIKVFDAMLILIAVAMILEIWGIRIAAIVAGLGIFGVAVALGAQDLFKNLIAGASILIEKRFNPGDWIKVDGVIEGVVQKINFRSTLIQRFDKAPTFVPNSALSDAPVTNFSRMTHRRIKWMIGVEYGSDVAQLAAIRNAIEDYIANSEDFCGPPEVPLFVRVDSFAASSIDILVYCFTRTTDWGQWLQIKEQLAVRIKQIVAEAGTGFAFPSRTLYIHPADDQDSDIAQALIADQGAGVASGASAEIVDSADESGS